MVNGQRKRSDVRTRTGCNRCRLRRVKCPEQKPTCAPCVKLGFDCSYGQQLRWPSSPTFEADTLEVAQMPAAHTENYMFLSTFIPDFFESESAFSSPIESESDSEVDESHPPRSLSRKTTATKGPNANSSLSRYSTAKEVDSDRAQSWNDVVPGLHQLPLLSSLRLSPVQSYLWEYFQNAIAPACVLDPTRNPYQDVILRIAASTGNTSPLFLSIMAISTSQLSILGDRHFYVSSCAYRQKALQSLRVQTGQIEGDVQDQSLEAQIIATVMAMVFLDILSDCSGSWVVHSDFARSRICRLREGMTSLDADLSSLLDFVGGYIVAHEVYAHTAWNADRTNASSRGHVSMMCDDSNLQTLTGCGTEFFQVLSDVNALVADYTEHSERDYVDRSSLADLDDRRRTLERQLHSYAPSNAPGNEVEDDPPDDISETALALDIKRLTGLLHMHSRIDHLGPDDSCVSALASRILRSIARVPTRSNIILWPLFMVATLGIGPHCDAERVFILQKLDALQRQRQMRYIKKARRIIVGVWKVRDVRDANMNIGWNILKEVTQEVRISLL